MEHARIAELFEQCFAQTHATVMLGGAAEPLYLPRGPSGCAELHYREDFAASALHEAAHWCIAGPRRRRLPDFGYDYAPPPRSPTAQAAFYDSERRVQALESIFAAAAGVRFIASADDLTADARSFALTIRRAVPELRLWLRQPAGRRAARFERCLAAHAAEPIAADG